MRAIHLSDIMQSPCLILKAVEYLFSYNDSKENKYIGKLATLSWWPSGYGVWLVNGRAKFKSSSVRIGYSKILIVIVGGTHILW